MRIENGQQLLAQIDAGRNFELDNRGQLQTQGFMSRVGQKIGDFFRSFTTQGKLDIMERNFRVQTAMTHMLRNDNALPNLATRPHATMPLAWAVRNTVVARSELAKQLDAVSTAARPGIRKAVMEQLRNAGTLDDGNPESVRAAVQRQVGLLSTPTMVSFFEKVNRAPTPNEQQKISHMMQEGLLKDFTPGKQLRNIGEFGIHADYLSDAPRTNVHINGTPATAENAGNMLVDSMTNMFRPFVSTALSLGGIDEAITKYMQGQGSARNNNPVSPEAALNETAFADPNKFRLPPRADLLQNRVTVNNGVRQAFIDTHDPNNITIKYSADRRFEYNEADPPLHLGTHRFDVTITIPKHQDLKAIHPSMVPQHTMTVKMQPL